MKIKSNQRKWLTLPQNGQLNFLTFLFPAAMASLCLVGPLCLPLRHFKPTPDLTVTLRMSMALSLTFDLEIDNDFTDTCDIRQVWFKMFPIYLQWSVINIIGCTSPLSHQAPPLRKGRLSNLSQELLFRYCTEKIL